MTTFKEIVPQTIGFVQRFREYQSAQKQRGINDANVFTTLLSAHDEVRLHSRFLAFLLDPNGKHYQDDLFLKAFLEHIKLSDFILNTEICTVHREYCGIDIYITDRTHHIIIENKIWASDQEKQIQRYIETIKTENKTVAPDTIAVVYLSPYGRQPSDYSLGDYRISTCGKYLHHQNEKYTYRQINYHADIIQWLESIHAEVKNITNLSVMMTQYRETVQQITGQYKGNLMTLLEYMQQNSDKNTIKNMCEISKAYEEYTTDILNHFKKAVESIKQENNNPALKFFESTHTKILDFLPTDSIFAKQQEANYENDSWKSCHKFYRIWLNIEPLEIYLHVCVRNGHELHFDKVKQYFQELDWNDGYKRGILAKKDIDIFNTPHVTQTMTGIMSDLLPLYKEFENEVQHIPQ